MIAGTPYNVKEPARTIRSLITCQRMGLCQA
jgi:hypothetical protein